MGKDKLIQVSKFYGDHSHAYWQAVNRHGHFGSGVKVTTLGVSPSLVSRWREGYSFWSS